MSLNIRLTLTDTVKIIGLNFNILNKKPHLKQSG